MSVRDITILGCSSQQPTRYRNHGAYIVRWNDEGFLFDPGEGTQRQFIFANIAPTCVTKILISHFHGDHCLGLGSMIMRLNLDKVRHPIHCYYPASGKKFFDRLRYGTQYHETVNVVEHPVREGGVVHDDGKFKIEAEFLEHGVDNIGWRVTEADRRKFYPEKLKAWGIKGVMVRELVKNGKLNINGTVVEIEELSWIRKGDSLAVVIDTLPCDNILKLADGAKLFLCEGTYLDKDSDLAHKHYHLTAKQAATLAKEAHAKNLILTHFSARYHDLSEFEVESRAIFPNTEVAEDMKRFPFSL